MAKKKTTTVTLPKEVKDLINGIKDKTNQTDEQKEFQEFVRAEKIKRGFDWDFRKEDQIDYFELDKSYEVTGYRPINNISGLDFDPSWFTEARDTYLRTGHYCSFPRNTKAYADFWTEEYIKCREGLTRNGYTITGNNYFFLNYYQLPNTETDKAGSSRTSIFPKFLVYQYEYFHYFELCKILRKNVCLMKSRAIGFSEIAAAIVANQYNSYRESISLVTAFSDIYVKKTLDKVWNALAFINDSTDGGFFKLTQAVNTSYRKKASYYKIVNGQQIEVGWKSLIEGIVADDDSKIRGDRVDLLVLEEAGHNKNLRKSFIKGEALCTVGGTKFGLIIAGGTGGDKGPEMEGLRDIYFNPDTYDVLKFKHNFTPTGDWTESSYFIPSYSAVYKEGFIDKRGYCDKEKAKKYYDDERAKRASSPKALIDYCAEFCYTAEEAFSLEGENKFNKVIIAEQLMRIRVLKQCPTIETGFLTYTYKADKHTDDQITGFRWKPDDNGKIHILEHPAWTLQPSHDENGTLKSVIPETNNLYVAGIDSIDIGMADTSRETRNPSQFCIVIKKRAYGLEEPKYAAYYKDRPQDVREAYKIAISLLRYYNCMVNIEATRVSMLSWARDHKYLHFFMKRPRATFGDLTKRNNSQYGTPGTIAVIDHQTDLIRDFIEDSGHTIWFEEMLSELERYSDENKTRFDIVAALGMCELADEELNGITPRKVDTEEDVFEDFGWYTDDRGYKHFGAIPKSNNKQTTYDPTWNPRYNDYSISKSSDPRKRL
jgi:hypothetical protein